MERNVSLVYNFFIMIDLSMFKCYWGKYRDEFEGEDN